MPQPYDLTNVTGSGNFYDLFNTSNALSGGLFGFLIILSVFIISYASLSKWGAKSAFATSSFITSGICILFRLINQISDKIMFASFILVAISIIWMRFD